MGTRADFWIGHGPQAEWLGSVGWDGYEWNERQDCPLMVAASEQEFRAAVESIMTARRDATRPADGWPWPWEDSRTTDYAYVLSDGAVRVFEFGTPIDDPDAGERDDWRDMTGVQRVDLGQRSGLIIASVPPAGGDPT